MCRKNSRYTDKAAMHADLLGAVTAMAASRYTGAQTNRLSAPGQPTIKTQDILSIIEGLSGLMLSSGNAPVPAVANNHTVLAGGSVHEFTDEKHVRETGDALPPPPTYDAAIARELPEKSYPVTTVETSDVYPANSTSVITQDVERFQAALTDYRSGVGGKCAYRRAAKTLARDMYDAAVDKRTAETGRLRCQEKKAIRRELKVLKHSLRQAAYEVKKEMRGQTV